MCGVDSFHTIHLLLVAVVSEDRVVCRVLRLRIVDISLSDADSAVGGNNIGDEDIMQISFYRNRKRNVPYEMRCFFFSCSNVICRHWTHYAGAGKL